MLTEKLSVSVKYCVILLFLGTDKYYILMLNYGQSLLITFLSHVCNILFSLLLY